MIIISRYGIPKIEFLNKLYYIFSPLGAPVVLSFPHFYFADSSYLNAVEGLQPNSSIHSFHIDVEPVSTTI